MPNFYRYINCSERKQLWSILSCQITLVTLSWYYIEIRQSNNECCKILKREYSIISPYITVPDNCTWWITFWFRINRYTLYTTLPFNAYVWHEYYISPCHILACIYTWMGLAFHGFEVDDQDNIFYRDAPFFLYSLLIGLYLEMKPFQDFEAIKRYNDIHFENDERNLAREEALNQCWIETIDKIRRCGSDVDIKQTIRQADEQTENNLLKYQLLDNPGLPPPEQKKKNIFFNGFIYVTSFFLCALSLWNYILVLNRAFYRPFNI